MRRPHYAWAVCLGGSLPLFAIMGLGVNIFTVYQPYIIRLNNFTNAQGSLITTVRSLFVVAAMLTVNQICARFGLRKVMTFAMELMGLSCLCFGLAKSFFSYCVAAALTGIAYGYGGMVPLSLLIRHWFRDRRSFALGLAATGSGVSTIFAPSIITQIIETKGMPAAFFAEGALIAVLGILVWVLVRNTPADMGLTAYHLGGEDVPTPAPRLRPEKMTQSRWYALFFAAFLIGAPAGPGFSHLTVLYTSCGYDSMAVASFTSFLGVTLCAGKLVCGQVYDTLGSRLGNLYIFGIFLAGFALCCTAPLGGSILPFAAMTLFGLGLPISNIPFAVWAGDLLGDAGYESAVRSLTVAYALGMLLSGPIAGILADRFNSYVPAYLLFAAILVCSMLIVQYIYRKVNVGQRLQKS